MIETYGEAKTQFLLNAAITKDEIKQLRNGLRVGEKIFIPLDRFDIRGLYLGAKPEWCEVKHKSTYVVVLSRENGKEVHLTYLDLCMMERRNELQREE